MSIKSCEPCQPLWSLPAWSSLTEDIWLLRWDLLKKNRTSKFTIYIRRSLLLSSSIIQTWSTPCYCITFLRRSQKLGIRILAGFCQPAETGVLLSGNLLMEKLWENQNTHPWRPIKSKRSYLPSLEKNQINWKKVTLQSQHFLKSQKHTLTSRVSTSTIIKQLPFKVWHETLLECQKICRQSCLKSKVYIQYLIRDKLLILMRQTITVMIWVQESKIATDEEPEKLKEKAITMMRKTVLVHTRT